MLKKYRDIYAGALLLTFGIFFLITARLLPTNADTLVDPGTMPTLMGSLLSLLGVIILWQGMQAVLHRLPERENAAVHKHYSLLICSLLLLFFYILLWQRIGFLVMTVLYLFAQTSIFCPKSRRSRRRLILFAAIALVTTALIWVIFSVGFHLTLPRGVLG